jgi:hypothetical protein
LLNSISEVFSPRTSLNMMNKIIITAVAAFALAAGAQAETKEVPKGAQAIVDSGAGQVEFYKEVGATNGSMLWWRFVVSNPDDNSAVMVTVPSNCTPYTFGAHVTVARDAVRYYATGEIPNGGYKITERVPVLDSILGTYKGVHFLGSFPNEDHTEARWAFYAEADGNCPAVVINVAPTIETVGQFQTAYWTAVDAVKYYIAAKQVQQEQQPKVTFQRLNRIEVTEFSTREHPLV